MSIHVMVRFNVKAEKQTDFQRILEDACHSLPQVKGCIQVKGFKDEAKKQEFCLLETWESKETHQDHVNHLIETGDWAFIESHLTEAPQSAYLASL